MMYLTFEEFTQMGGTLSDAVFQDLGFEAQTIIDWYTFGRLKNIEADKRPEELKRCMYRLITYLKDLQDATAAVGSDGSLSTGGSAGIASQSNDGVSISYNTVGASEKLANAEKEKAKIVQMYLSTVVDSLGRRVLYRGLYPGE